MPNPNPRISRGRRGGAGHVLRLLLAVLSLVSFACEERAEGKETVPAEEVTRTPSREIPAGESPAPPQGRWARRRGAPGGDPPVDEALEREIRRLETLAYVDGAEPAPEAQGVTVFSPERAYAGYNLYISGHAPQAILIDMEGNELHRWSIEFAQAFRLDQDFDRAGNRFAFEVDLHNFRRVHLLENGDLLAIFEGFGLVKLDRDSNLLWARPNRSHHDLEIAESGQIYVLTREVRVEPSINPDQPVVLDFISVLDAAGNEVERISVYDAFLHSPFRARVTPVRFVPSLVHLRQAGDFMHTNTLEILDGRLSGRSAAFRRGNLLVSLRELALIAVIDPRSQQVVWSHSGFWSAQHQPTVLDNGNLLIFDNLGGSRALGGSRVVEFDPFTLELEWVYQGTPESQLESSVMGSCQRLPNGNTLITETQAGRVIEVTPEQEVVWEFLNPHRAGERDELIAVIPEMVRLGPDLPLDWLTPPSQVAGR